MTEARPPALFIADAPGLDFLNSTASPSGTPVEWLAGGDDLLEWLSQAQLVPAKVLAAIRAKAVPGELDAVAAQARALREWFRAFVRDHMGKSLPSDAVRKLAPLNRVLARDDEFGQVVARRRPHDHGARSGVAWQPQRRWRSPESLLIPIAKAMAELVCAEDFAQVKACGGPRCTLYFLDRTRGQARRWCSMALCGNRAKQAAHRKRARRARAAPRQKRRSARLG